MNATSGTGTSGTGSADGRGVLGHQPVLDLSHLSSPEQLAGITRIEQVATVVVPQSLAAAYTLIPSSRVARTVFVPDGANVRVHTGPLMVGGDGLGTAEDVLVVIGILIITSPVTGPVPRQVTVVGSVLTPPRRRTSSTGSLRPRCPTRPHQPPANPPPDSTRAGGGSSPPSSPPG